MVNDPAVHRELVVTDPPMEGRDVANLQRGIKARLEARGLADEVPTPVHGKFTQATWFGCVEAGYFLGLRSETYLATSLGRGACSEGAQTIIRNPESRTPEQLARAAQRKNHVGPRYYAQLSGANGNGNGGGHGVASPLGKILGDSWGYHGTAHDGVDLICEGDATLYALCDAKVIDVRSAGWWGKGARASGGHPVSDGDGIIQLECLIDQGPFRKGLHFGYGHAEKATVAVGQSVKAGQKIGHAGFANAWHVHFMVNGGGSIRGVGDRDPLPFVKYAVANG
jgi:murein DD-endopeptidase MepM/ murein hydrolase activator NlpD